MDIELTPGEGQICRWCQEGEYVIREADNAHLTADPSNNTIECDVCGEPPMTFEECEVERQAQQQ